MPPLGTAPRRISPGVWKTAKGKTLTPAQATIWEGYFHTGKTDGRGHFRKTPSVVQAPNPLLFPRTSTAQPYVPPKKPSFDTFAKVKKGDQQALGQINRWATHKHAETQGAQQAQAVRDIGLFGAALPAIQSANTVVNPVAGGVIESLSPTNWFPNTLSAARGGHVNPLGIGLEAASIFPFGRFARAGKAAVESAHVAEAARPAVADEVLAATKGAKKTYAGQEALRAVERSRRVALGRAAYEGAGGGVAGHEAVRGALAGEMPVVKFSELQHLTPENVQDLFHAIDQTNLRFHEKNRLRNAILNAKGGKVPTPSEVKLIEKAFGPEAAYEAIHKHPIAHVLGEIVNLPRSILASGDFSFGFRQALVASAMEPRLFAKNFRMQFKEAFSPKYYDANIKAIEDNPMYPRADEAGVSFSQIGGGAGRAEEQFPSTLAEKVTGGKHGLVASSSRAYTGFANRLRMDLFAKLARDYEGMGVSDKDIATVVNWATGRGNLDFMFKVGSHKLGEVNLERSSPVLNTLFFAPRLFQTRIQAMNPFFYASLPKPLRMKAMASMAKLVSGGTTLLGLALLAGAKVSADPRNADFGKIKVGNTRFDIWGGHQQLARLLAQIETGTIISSTTGKPYHLAGGFGKTSKWDVIDRFRRGKMAPGPALIEDWFRGTDFNDQPFSVKTAVVQRAYPLLIQDAIDVYHGTDSPWAAAGVYGIGSVGVGVQSYGPRKPKSSGKDPFANVGVAPAIQTGSSTDPFANLPRKRP